ncbi:TPA: aspartate aminotransferase family protein [bacterium]|nr:aspartate aminotransferase family protein [bacterium]
MNKVPNIKTKLPGPKSLEYLDYSKKYEPRSMSEQVPVVWNRAIGATVEDVDGNWFIDFTSGVLVTNIGHCHPRYVDEMKKQCEELYNCYDFVTSWRAMLAKKLVEITPENLGKAFILTTGSETIEAAIKLARRYKDGYEIISFNGAFHGRTYGGMSVGGKMGVKRGFGPTVPGTIHAYFPYCYRCAYDKTFPECDYWCFQSLDQAVDTQSTGEIAGLITEPYQGGAGSIIPPPGYLKKLENWCKEHDILFILDEVQASFGRTGFMFALERENLRPNLLCLGKGIGSGVPLAAIVGETEIMEVLDPGSMSSTYGGNPISSRAGLVAIDIIEKENLVENSAKVGEHMLNRFKEMQKKCEFIGDVRGQGLVLGLEIVHDKKTKEPAKDITKKIVDGCYQKGLILIAPIGFHGNVIRIAPPLMISQELADKGLDIFEEVIYGID